MQSPPPAKIPAPDPTAQLTESAALGILSDQAEALELISDPLQNFPGITTGARPPDTVHDVGPNHVVQMTNTTFFQVWDKQGNDLSGGPLNFGGLWPVGNRCRTNLGDPIVVYDHLADRWLLSQFTRMGPGTPPFGMCIAISMSPVPLPASITGDPADGFFLYTLIADPPFNAFPDYPKFGVWPDGYYMTSFEGANLGIFVFDRQAMLNGNAVQIFKTTIPSLGGGGVRATRILPTDLDGPQPPDGTPNFFVRTVDDQQDAGNPTDRIEVYEAIVDWAALTFNFNLVDTITPPALAGFDIMTCNRNGAGVRDCIPQPDEVDTLDALSNRPMMQAKFRNFEGDFRIVFNQTIDVQGSIPFVPTNEVAGIRWYELENTGGPWDISQQGTFAPQPTFAGDDNELLHRWMGSAAIDTFGNIALGYSIVNSDSDNSEEVYPGIRYTGRRFDDPLGLMQAEKVILNGTGPQGNGDGTVDPQRWGDYSAMTVDPRDDCTFWYTTHVAFGATQIASFRFDACELGHFLFHNVSLDDGSSPFEPLQVHLEDQFGAAATVVVAPRDLANPADKNDEGIADPETHYVGYAIKQPRRRFEPVRVLVSNQFGDEQVLDVLKAVLLLVPSAKSLDAPVDPLGRRPEHFQCYVARQPAGEGFEELTVTIADQFDELGSDYRVVRPTKLCSPVDKDGEGVVSPADHLVCYAAVRDGIFGDGIVGIHTNNQFGPLVLRARLSFRVELCVPSIKELPDIDG